MYVHRLDFLMLDISVTKDAISNAVSHYATWVVKTPFCRLLLTANMSCSHLMLKKQLKK